MSERKLTILGSASQIPTRHRNQTGFFFKWDKEGFLFDPGEGTQRQMTRFGIPVSAITNIFLTHFHGDHCLGLSGIIQRISLDRVAHKINLFYPASGQLYFERLVSSAIFFNRASLKTYPISTEDKISLNGKFSISALPLDHSIDVLGYRISEKDSITLLPDKLESAGIRGKAVGELIKRGEMVTNGQSVGLNEVSVLKPGQSLAFVMDTRLCQNVYKLAQKADLMICEATYLATEKHLAEEYGHLTAAQAAEIAQKAGVKKLVLSHFSQRYPCSEVFVKEAGEIHRDVIAPDDGETILMPKRNRML